MSSTAHHTKQDDSSASEWMEVVISKIRNLRYGSVQITVHDGRVTLVESIEKTRFASDSPQPPKNR